VLRSSAVNKTIIITGGSSGIGAAAARELRRQGATVAITGRSAETARLANEIGCDHYHADFARFRDIRMLAEELLAKYSRIDVLANNVGGVFAKREITEDGHEKTLQVNHLSAFLLTWLLRGRLESSEATVINTSSGAHRMGRLDFDDLENARHYSPWRAYGTAKLMNVLHASELNRRFDGVHGLSFHPGVVATGFAREGNPVTRMFYKPPFSKIFMITPEKGADTLAWLATTQPVADWKPGQYYVKRKLASRSRAASDPDLARRWWDESMRLAGIA